MKNSEQFEKLLKQVLSPTVNPSEDLNQKIINQLKENNIMKSVYKKRLSSVVLAVTFTIVVSITVFAAWNFLSSKQVAQRMGNNAVAKAFDSEDAIEINKSTISGEYSFTLLGITSGENFSDFKDSENEVNPDVTYAVVSIAKQDGSKMPDTKDDEYGQIPFFISPLIKGQKPWQYNISSMNGGYQDIVVDGIMYRLIECDGVEMFADRGLYLCISTSNFYDINAFNYNEETGEVSVNNNYDGANALFDLNLDITKADHEKAEKYLNVLWEEASPEAITNEELDSDSEKEIENTILIPKTIE